MNVRECTVTLGPNDFQPSLEVGVYFGPHMPPERGRVECPYCHELMYEAKPTTDLPKRIMKIVERLPDDRLRQRAVVLAHVIPESHVVLACRECRAVFTRPILALPDPHKPTGTK